MSMLTLYIKQIPNDWEQQTGRMTSFGEFAVYKDSDGNLWFVPEIDINCSECNATGLDDDEEEGVCWICDGKGYETVESVEDALSEQDYEALSRQNNWLIKRYGYIPRDIHDYWQAQS